MNKIRQIFIVVFCLQLTFPTIVVDFLRIPALISHYLDHHHSENDFLHFIEDHYADEHHDEDHENHKNLPFHYHNNIANGFVAIELEKRDYSIMPHFQKIDLLQPALSDNFFLSNIDLGIWRPPKSI